MIRCPSCGMEGPDEDKFCGSCGNPLLPSQPTRCPSCQAELSVGASFCGKCGAPVSGRPAEAVAAKNLLCPRCGATNPHEASFCAACGGDLQARTPGPARGPATVDPAITKYLTILDRRLATSNFEPFENPPALNLDRAFRRKKFQLLQVGMVTTFCGITHVDSLSDTGFMNAFNKSVFDYALRNKGFFARNAFQSLLVYQIIVASRTTPEVQRYLDSYWPKHWMAYEFPVVVDLSADRMLYLSGTPIWGLLFHAAFKQEAIGLFSTV